MTRAALTVLRDGADREPLFMIPGAGGAAKELAGLAQALPGGRAVIGVEPFTPGDEGARPATVEAMAAQTVAAMRARQPTGPYHLLGYSFGGLVALEAARLLCETGEVLALVGLIDTIFDRRYWPSRLFLLATLRRTVGHLGRLARRPLGEALPELFTRARRLAGRFAARRGASAPPKPAPAGAGPTEALCLAAMAAYRPRPCAVPVTFFASRQDADFGCDPPELWRPWCADLSVQRIDGAHLALVREPGPLTALARAVGAALAAAQGPRPLRVLLAAGFNWIATARLALGLTEAGFVVQAACPRRHTLRRLGFLERCWPLRALQPAADLTAAIEAARADLIVPCDDRMTQTLHGLHAAADPASPDGAAFRARLERSLGAPEAYPWLYARAALMVAAEEEGVRCPPSARVRTAADVTAWFEAHPGRAVLKTDGSWGGREVVAVDGPEAARRAFRRLHAPPDPLRALKRLAVDGDAMPLRRCLARRRPQLSIQAFVDGAPGNSAVACLDGEVLAAVHVEVIRTVRRQGPATVVRVVDHPEMDRAVRAMVRRLRLSGLCGFDFMLEGGAGVDGDWPAAHLIELNPRAVPTAHLIGADGGDLLAALHAALRRREAPHRRRPSYAGGLVALFPQELRRDPVSDYLRLAHHDVPWHAPELVELALAESQTSRAILDRLAQSLPGAGTRNPPR